MKKPGKRQLLEMQVQDHLGVIALLQNARAHKLLAPHDLSLSQFTLLFLLSDDLKKAWTISLLGEHLEMQLPGIGKMVAQLEGKGFLRVEADQQDKRKKFVLLTTKGNKKTAAILKSMNSVVSYTFADWSNKDLAAFSGQLGSLKTWLDEHREDFGEQ